MSTGMIWQTVSTGSGQTERLGRLIGENLKGGEVIELRSDLGGGKTTFVRGLAAGAGSKNNVVSPTFTIMRRYKVRKAISPEVSHADGVQGAGEQRTEVYAQYSEGAAQPATPQSAASASGAASSAARQAGAVREFWIYHFDFYRLDDPGILRDQLAESVSNDKAVVIVEWADIVVDVLPKKHLSIEFRPTANEPDERQINVSYHKDMQELITNVRSRWEEIRP